jgi:[ribosomal protein S18]-alanine N-acetyltransferase
MQFFGRPRPLALPATIVGVSFQLRDFRPDDFETLWRIDQQCFPPGIAYSRQELKIYMRRSASFTLVALPESAAALPENDSIVAFIVAGKGPVGHIITIDVLAGARRSGVGSMLLRAAEQRLRGAGSRAVGLETAVDNTAALSFYKRHGYHVVDTYPRYYSNGVDALVLTKDLAQEGNPAADGDGRAKTSREKSPAR